MENGVFGDKSAESLQCTMFFYACKYPARDVTRVSVMPGKVTVKIGDAENQCRGCRDKNQ